MLGAETNRSAAGPVAPAGPAHAHIAWLERALQDLERDLQDMLRASPGWRAAENLLTTVRISAR